MTDPKHPYPDVDPNVRFPDLDARVLKSWQEDGTFKASIENRERGENGANEYVFYDGPPFATGLPHYGHILAGNIKDIVTRYLDLDTSPHDSPTPAQHSASHFSSIISCA